jgi:hypothetical protein
LRTIHTYVLRLLVDPNHPGVMGGTLYDVTNGETHNFSNLQAMFAWLRLLVNPLSKPTEDEKRNFDQGGLIHEESSDFPFLLS